MSRLAQLGIVLVAVAGQACALTIAGADTGTGTGSDGSRPGDGEFPLDSSFPRDGAPHAYIVIEFLDGGTVTSETDLAGVQEVVHAAFVCPDQRTARLSAFVGRSSIRGDTAATREPLRDPGLRGMSLGLDGDDTSPWSPFPGQRFQCNGNDPVPCRAEVLRGGAVGDAIHIRTIGPCGMYCRSPVTTTRVNVLAFEIDAPSTRTHDYPPHWDAGVADCP